MKPAHFVLLVLAALAALAGCRPLTQVRPTVAPTEPILPTDTALSPAPPDTSAPPSPTLSFDPATYENAASGVALEYPSHWTVGPDELQARGGITAFTSWLRSQDVLPGETPPGETRFDLTVQLWDPGNDLKAFIAQRRGAWEASGNRILSEERSTLPGGGPVAAFVVEATDGVQSYFFLTTSPEAYLVLSGTGDLDLLVEIAGTVRLLPVAH